MKMKARYLFVLVSFLFVFFCLNTFVSGYANVSRSANWRSFAPRMAIDSIGNIHVVWGDYYTPYTGKYDPPGNGDAFYAKYDQVTQEWSEPFNVSNSSLVFSPEVRNAGIAIDINDNIYVVYVERNRVLLRVCSGGIWNSPFEIANSGDRTDQPRIAVDSAGNLFISWWAFAGGIVYSRARIDGAWEDVRTLSPPGKRSKFPNIAVGNNVVFCTWQEGGSERGYTASYARRGKAFGAAWSASQLVATTADVGNPDVKIDANDIAHIVYMALTGAGFDSLVYYCRWTGSSFSSPVVISDKRLQHYASIYEREGNLYVAWQAGSWGHGTRIYYNNRINGGWSGEAKLPGTGGCTFVDVATSPSQATTYYVWDDMGQNPFGTWDIWCNMGETGTEPPPGDLPPIPQFSFSPTTGLVPLEVTFDASASSDPDGTIVKYSWDFGDGKSGLGQIVSHIYEKSGTLRVALMVTDDLGARATKSALIEVKGLQQPLNIRWSTHVDESLFKTSTVAEITWERNPENDALGAQITGYRIYRKLPAQPNSAYIAIGEVAGSTYRFVDRKAEAGVSYAYTVTSFDNAGHESPIASGAASLSAPLRKKDVRNPKRSGKIASF